VSAKHPVTKLLVDLASLLRGSLEFRFYAGLVAGGVALMLGPGFWVQLAIRLLDIRLGPDSSAERVTLGVTVFGGGMIVAGVALFVLRPKSNALSPGAVYNPDGRETFEDIADLFARNRSKTVDIIGLSAEERARPLLPGQIKARDAIALLRGLGDKVRDSSSFPPYSVREGATKITIKARRRL
jgi:hypothetical protein